MEAVLILPCNTYYVILIEIFSPVPQKNCYYDHDDDSNTNAD